jgi:hypothetical protein
MQHTYLANVPKLIFFVHSQYGHIIPAYRLTVGDTERHVEMEIFDLQSWPQRPQYDLTKSTRITLTMQGQSVKFFSPEWIFCEKVLSQHGREGSLKGLQDLGDVIEMLRIAQPNAPEMDFDGKEEMVEALRSFLHKRPEARSLIAKKLKCDAILVQP